MEGERVQVSLFAELIPIHYLKGVIAMKNKAVPNSLKTIKANPKILLYSLMYTVMVMLLSVCRSFVFYKIMIWGEWEIPHINNSVLYFIASFLFESIEMVILTSFVYMLIKSKMKFKRFFSFMSIKNLKYNILFSLLIILPKELLNLVLNSETFKNSAFFSVAVSVVCFIFLIFIDIMIYFKAANNKEGIGGVFRMAVDYLASSFGSVFVCCLELLIPAQIVTMFLGLLFQPIADDILLSALLPVHYGVDILLIPAYFLSLNDLNKCE